MKKLFIIFIIIAVVLQGTVPFVFAQEATNSGSTVPTDATTQPNPIVPILPSQMTTPTPSPSFSSDVSQSSAQIKVPPIVKSLMKKNFKAGEKVTIDIENADTTVPKVTVLDHNGTTVDFEEFSIDSGSQKQIVINPPLHFTPGKYTVTVEVGGQTYTQDFTWGVLAINTNKSIYLPNEKAQLAMAVLDETGDMVCDAKTTLTITDPTGTAKTLSTDTGTISINPQCKLHEVSMTPDYGSSYQVGGVGTYQMDLSAETKNGKYSITDSFEVKESVPFDVERVSATRIFPPNQYPVDLKITANQDFFGTIVEEVPGDFAINPSPSSDFPYAQVNAYTPSGAQEVLQASLSAQLGMPFTGSHPIDLEFGQPLKDTAERNWYAQFNLAGHDGVDFGMDIGTPILSIDDGTVSLAGPGAYGTTLVIDHTWGKSYYGHLSKLEVQVGDHITKGQKIALSGNSGLTTGPHLHFGIKPNTPNMENGYYGKIDPLPFLGLQSQIDSSSQIKLITWNVSLKKGDTKNIGYFYQAPNISPQFYRDGPLRFYEGSSNIFSEARQWQIAVDADGSGTNTVSATTGQTNAIGQTYTFTYTTGESVATGSGSMTISIPAGWTAPQTSNANLPGYTTVSSSSTGTSADVLNNLDTDAPNWQISGTGTNHKVCNAVAPVTDSTLNTEGAGSLKCPNAGVSSGDYFYRAISAADWSMYTKVGAWIRTSVALGTLSHLQFAESSGINLGTTVDSLNLSTATLANTWVYETFTFTSSAASRTGITAYGFVYGSNSTLDSNTIWVDYMLLGPGSPIVTGSGPWTVTTNILTIPATTGTIVLNYGTSGTSAVTNPSSASTYTFTTQSKIAANPRNALASIGASPTVIISSGPSLSQLMRHGKWFSNTGTNNMLKQPFTF